MEHQLLPFIFSCLSGMEHCMQLSPFDPHMHVRTRCESGRLNSLLTTCLLYCSECVRCDAKIHIIFRLGLGLNCWQANFQETKNGNQIINWGKFGKQNFVDSWMVATFHFAGDFNLRNFIEKKFSLIRQALSKLAWYFGLLSTSVLTVPSEFIIIIIIS